MLCLYWEFNVPISNVNANILGRKNSKGWTFGYINLYFSFFLVPEIKGLLTKLFFFSIFCCRYDKMNKTNEKLPFIQKTDGFASFLCTYMSNVFKILKICRDLPLLPRFALYCSDNSHLLHKLVFNLNRK